MRYETMATLTIKNLPDDIYAALTLTAKKNRRSINNEAIVQLERSLDQDPGNTDAVLQRVRGTRERMATDGVWLTDKLLEVAKKEGRP